MKRRLTIFLALAMLLAVTAPAAAESAIREHPMRGGGSSYGFVWSPDGSNLIVMDLKNAVIIYDSSDLTAAPRVIPIDSSLGLASGTEAVSPDGTILAAASYVEPFVQMWDLTTFELLPPIPAALNIAADETMRAVRFSPDGTLLAVQTTIAVHLIDLATGTELAEFEAYARGPLAFSPDGTLLAVPICQPLQCDAVGGILAWDVTAGEIVETVETDDVFNQLLFISNTELLAAKRTTGIFVLDLESNEETLVYDGPYGEISYSPQNDLISTSMMSTMTLIERQNPSEPLKIYVDVQFVAHAMLNPAGTMVALGLPNGKIEVRDTSTGDVIAQLEPGSAADSTDVESVDNPLPSNADWKPVIQEFDGVQMVQVPAGCFMMGSETGEPDEMPVHEVCLDAFWMDRTEVTNAQFAAFDGQAGRSGEWTGDNYPRENITWDEAQAFCESRGGRLPTEAEWEYAARGPEEWTYPWGNEFGNYNAEYSETADDNQTGQVACHLGGASWVGALDMIGNVYEWTADWYGPYVEESQENPTVPDTGRLRTLRGGAYYLDASQLWASNRAKDLPDDKSGTIGFRCVRAGS